VRTNALIWRAMPPADSGRGVNGLIGAFSFDGATCSGW
jgi:hypothetical protein